MLPSEGERTQGKGGPRRVCLGAWDSTGQGGLWRTVPGRWGWGGGGGGGGGGGVRE